MNKSQWRQFLKIDDVIKEEPVTHNVVMYEPKLEQPPKDKQFIVFCLGKRKAEWLGPRAMETYLEWMGTGRWRKAAEAYYIDTTCRDMKFIILPELHANMRWSILPGSWRWK